MVEPVSVPKVDIEALKSELEQADAEQRPMRFPPTNSD